MSFCHSCGAPAAPGAAACTRCGAVLAASPSVTPFPPPPAAPGATFAAPPLGGVAPPAGHAPAGWVPPPASPQWPPPPNAWPTPSGGYPAPGRSLPEVQAQVSQAFDKLVRDIRSFQFKWVVPIDTAMSPEFISNRSVWVMLLFAFLPLAALTLELVKTVGGFVKMLELYFGLAWVFYYYYFVARRSVDLRVGAAVTAFTALVGINIVLLTQNWPILSSLYAGLHGSDPTRALIGFVFGVGPNEELCKALPVLLIAFAIGRLEKPIDGIFYGACSGLGFCITEAADYVMSSQGSLLQILLRGTTLPFLHSLWSAIMGYFIALAVINRSRAPALVVTGLLVSATLHGLYDFFSDGLLGVAIAAFTYLLFVSYMERSQVMVAEIQMAEQQAAERLKMQALWQQQYGTYAMPATLSTPLASSAAWGGAPPPHSPPPGSY